MPPLNADNTALLVIDKQKGYIDPSQPLLKAIASDTDELSSLLPAMDEFIDSARALGLLVVWTQMVEDLKLSPANIAAKMLASGLPSLITPTKVVLSLLAVSPNQKIKY